MRTRIALVAIAPVAVITITVLIQFTTQQLAQAAATPSTGRNPISTAQLARSSFVLDLNAALLAPVTKTGAVASTSRAPATTPAPPPGPAGVSGSIDTVTPADRAGWERVAMCEEGGNWSADSPRFSGGLGVTRANWDAYGGREFAPEGAMATEDQQIMVAERIQPYPPDQYGCRGW